MKLDKNFKGKFTSKGGRQMSTLLKDKEPEKLTCMADMKKLVQNAVKEKGLTKEQVIKTFGLNRYAK